MKTTIINNQIEMFKNTIRRIDRENDVQKTELFESILKDNVKMQAICVEQIIKLEQDKLEEEVRVKNEQINSELISFELATDKSINEDKIVASFGKKLKEIYKDTRFISDVIASDRQRMTIFDGLRDRVGMTLDKRQISFINGLNTKQASEVIRLLKGISFLNQRQQLTEVVKGMRDNEKFAEILGEVKKNIHKREWFELNKDLINAGADLVPPTEAQVKMIAGLAQFVETHETLKSTFNIDVRDYEVREYGKSYYSFNKSKLMADIEEEFSKEDAHNFLQTYEYLRSLYAGKTLDQEQKMHIRKLYIQLGEVELTRPSHINTIPSDLYDYMVQQLEHAVRIEMVAKNNTKSDFRNQYNKMHTKREAREVRSIVTSAEQEQAKELQDFVHSMYSIVGELMGEDCQEFMPYFIQSGEVKYALVEEQHKQAFRKWFLERKQIIQELNKDFKFGAFVMNQPNHIIELIMGDMI